MKLRTFEDWGDVGVIVTASIAAFLIFFFIFSGVIQ